MAEAGGAKKRALSGDGSAPGADGDAGIDDVGDEVRPSDLISACNSSKGAYCSDTQQL
jgi:hypothetical protein